MRRTNTPKSIADEDHSVPQLILYGILFQLKNKLMLCFKLVKLF